MGDLKGKNIVITGCQQGIGQATMEAAARAGANVFACFMEETEDNCRLMHSLEEENGIWIEPLYFNFKNPDEIKAAAKRMHGKKVAIDGLANIAGMNRDLAFSMITRADLEEIFQVNYFGQLMFTQYVVKMMLRNPRGASMVNVGSIAATNGNAGQTVYAATKAAWISTTRCLAKELGPKIRVNAISPGIVDTPMTHDLMQKGIMDKGLSKISLKRLGQVTEAANLIVFLLSDRSSFTTRQIIRLDGGMP